MLRDNLSRSSSIGWCNNLKLCVQQTAILRSADDNINKTYVQLQSPAPIFKIQNIPENIQYSRVAAELYSDSQVRVPGLNYAIGVVTYIYEGLLPARDIKGLRGSLKQNHLRRGTPRKRLKGFREWPKSI